MKFNAKIFSLAPMTAALVGGGLAVKPLFDPDNDWHLAAGRWMWRHFSFIDKDPFSYTFAGRRWVSITWLHEILTYALSTLGGNAAFVAGAAALAGLCLYFLFRACAFSSNDGVSPWKILAFVCAAGILAETRWAGRPEMWSHMLGAAFLFALARFWKQADFSQGAWKKLALKLIPLQILWANTHGVFIMGPIMAGSLATVLTADDLLIERKSLKESKSAWLLVITLAAACFVNPRGATGALFPFYLFKVMKSPVFGKMIPEGTTPFGAGLWTSDAYTLVGLIAAYLSLVVVALWNSRRDRNARVWFGFGLVLVLGLIDLSVSARRNIPLLALWGLPFATAAIARLAPSRMLVAGLSFLALVGFGRFDALSESKQALWADGFRRPDQTPEGVARFLDQRRPSGHVFATATTANYLIYRLPDYFRSYIDARFAEVFDAEHFTRYMTILANPMVFEREAEERKIDHVVIGHELPIATGLLSRLALDKANWRLVYLDDQSAVFVRKGVAEYEAWAPVAIKEWHHAAELVLAPSENADSSAARLAAWGRALSLAGESELARKAFTNAVLRDPADYAALTGLCNVEWMNCVETEKNEVCAERAYRACDRAVKIKPDALPALLTAGLAAQAAGHVSSAKILFERSLDIDPISFEARWSLARLLRTFIAEHSPPSVVEEALQAYGRAVSLRPYNPEPLLEFAELMDSVGLKKDAESAYRQVLALGAPPSVQAEIKKRLGK